MSKLIVITGGTKGIGKTIIERFSTRGFDVITCSRSEDDLKSLKKSIESNYNNRLLYQTVDLGERSEVYNFIDFIRSQDVPVDVLVNNAGLFIPGQIHEEEDDILEIMLNVNLKSAYWLSKNIARQMKGRKEGHIFNICSTASIMAYVNGGSYSISKFAMYGMSKVLREELKDHNVRVTSVIPGATYTASWEGSELPESRFMQPSDVAATVYTAYELSKRSVIEEVIVRPQLGDI